MFVDKVGKGCFCERHTYTPQHEIEKFYFTKENSDFSSRSFMKTVFHEERTEELQNLPGGVNILEKENLRHFEFLLNNQLLVTGRYRPVFADPYHP